MATELVHEIEISPAFHDLDPMEVVWHGHYFKYLEIGRSALLQRYGYDYAEMRASGYLWPIVDARIKYVRPLRYGQRIRVRAEIVEWEFRLKIEYLLTDFQSGERLTRAHTIQVAVCAATGELQYACPAVLHERLGVAAP